MERTQWKEKQIERLEHRCENIYIDEGIKIYILDLIEQAVSDCGTAGNELHTSEWLCWCGKIYPSTVSKCPVCLLTK